MVIDYLRKKMFSVTKYLSTSFLSVDNIEKKYETYLNEKMRRQSNTNIGKEIGVDKVSSFNNIPLTTYNLYRKYFEQPNEGDFIYPLNDYVKVSTSGTMGVPKSFLLPRSAISENLRKTGLATLWISSHDGEKYAFEAGDTFYTNLPGGTHITAYHIEIGKKQNKNFVNTFFFILR